MPDNNNPASSTPTVASGATPGSAFSTSSSDSVTVSSTESSGSVFQNTNSTAIVQEADNALVIIDTNVELAQQAATDAATAKVAAETAQTAAEAALDAFDDTYLGAKSSDPSVDNDGNALIDGALYYNTTDDLLKVYDLATTSWLITKPTTAQQTNIDTVAGISSNINTVAGNTSNINTVADISSDVTAVANISTDIQDVQNQLNDIQVIASDLQEVTSEIDTVAFNINDITTVAGIDTYVSNVALNSSNISTVSGISSDVTTVAGISSDVTTVAADGADIGTVAGISSDVSTVAGISSDVTTVAADGTDIGTVAGISSDVTTVSGISANVTSVANVSSDVTTVAGISSDVTAVANISQDIQDVQDQLTAVQTVADDLQEVTSEIETVAASITNVDTVAGISGNVTTVAGVSSDVTTVAGVASNVTTVAGISSDVSTVAADQTDIGTLAGISTDIQTLADIEDGTDATDAIQTVAGISSNVSTVSGISSDVTTVANNNTNVTTVAGNNTNISTVAGISSDVTSVAGISSDVTTVAADGTDIGTVAGISSDIQTLADIEDGTSATNAIQTVSGISSDVTTVSGISSNVTTVANDGADIGVVAGISSDIQTLADIEDGTNATNAIQTVSGISSNVSTVAGISSNVTTVAGDSTDIGVVSGLSGDIQTLADIEDGTTATNAIQTTANSASNIDTVAGAISNVNTVAGNTSNINTVAGISSDVSTVSGISGNVTTVAGINSDVTSVAGIASNVTTVANSISDVNTFATTYRIGSSDPTTSLDEGDLFYNTTDNALKYYNGTSWSSITAGLTDIVGDSTPQLGGTLDANGNTIDMGTYVITDAKVGQWDTSYGWGDHSVAGYLEKSGGTMTGALTLSGAPTANLHATTKAYVDGLIAAGIHYHDPVRVESPDSEGNLNTTYNNGTNGVGATLTNNGTQAALVIDGVTLNTNDRVLIYNQTNDYENGIYTVTNTGSASTNWVLTRATDADSYGLGNQSLNEGASVFVLEGDDGAGEVYACTTTGTITFGTTAINFSQIGRSAVISGGTSITVDSNTVSVTDNSIGATQLNVSGNGTSGQVLKSDGDGTFSWANDIDTTYSVATSSTAGIVKVGYTENGKNYPVELDSDQMYVNVPWTDTDTNTTYSEATSGTLGLVKIGYTETGQNYPVELSSSQMYVNVPWTDTNTTYSTATSSTLGLVKTGYTENGKNYPVELSSGQMFVNVPWTDTDTNTTYSAGTGLTLSGTTFSVTANNYLPYDITNNNNFNFTGNSTTDQAGLYVEDSQGSAMIQIYGTPTNVGFLDGKWASWDLKKTLGGDLEADHGGTLYKVWDAYNDGSGSGLDADLLDGQQGSYYQAASNALTTTTNFGGDVSGTYNAIVVADDSHNHVWGNIDGASVNAWSSLRVSTSSGYIDFGPANTSHAHIYTDRPNFYFNKELRVNNNLVWDAGNDGSGSGLDADLLDGQHASAFASSSHSHSYLPLSGGTMTGAINMNNSAITNLNNLTFNDPGPSEGISWSGGNGWNIYESPNDLTTNSSGNLQFTTGSTRRATLDTAGNLTIGGTSLTVGIGQTSSNIYMTDSDNTTRRIHCNSNQIGFLTSANAWGTYSDNSANWYATSSMRAPIFYDSANTGYYCDPAGASNFSTSVRANEFYARNWFRNDASGEGLYNQATGQHWYSDDDDYWNIAGGTTANGIRFRDEHAGTVRGYVYADSSNQIGFLDSDGQWAIKHVRDSRTEFLINNVEYAEINTDYFYHSSDIRSQLFYDTNNTGYYADFAGTSIFNDFRCDIMFDKDNTSYYARPGSTSIFNDLRSNVYYDNNNTAYKIDAASTSVLNDIYLEGEIYHNGDTNTYIQFHAADQFRVVTGGVQRLEVNNSFIECNTSVVSATQVYSGSGLLTPNFDAYTNFVWTLTGNTTLNSVSTEDIGKSGVFVFIHSGAGRTVSLGTDYDTVGGGGLTLSTTSGAVDIVPYFIRGTNAIMLGTPILDVK